jgi:hypothetical protein
MEGMGESGRGAENLTGVWNGLYTYPQGNSVSFVATLIDSGGSFSGTIHEPCIFRGGTIYATLSGTLQSNAVSFLKTYDKSAGPGYGSVQYEGVLNGDATEIEGRWTIPGHGSGAFRMIRPAGARQTIARKSAAKV